MKSLFFYNCCFQLWSVKMSLLASLAYFIIFNHSLIKVHFNRYKTFILSYFNIVFSSCALELGGLPIVGVLKGGGRGRHFLPLRLSPSFSSIPPYIRCWWGEEGVEKRQIAPLNWLLYNWFFLGSSQLSGSDGLAPDLFIQGTGVNERTTKTSHFLSPIPRSDLYSLFSP